MSKPAVKPTQQSLFQGYLWRHNFYCLFRCWYGNSKMWMFIWLIEEVAKCYAVCRYADNLACLLTARLCWHLELNLNAKAVLTQPSCLSSADGGAASSSAPLLWDMSVREGWGETTTPWQAGGKVTGRWLSTQDRSWLVYWLSHPSRVWEATLSPLKGSDLCCPIYHNLLLQRCSLVFFCVLSCHCLSGLEHCICIWSSMLDIECIC